MFIHRAWVWCLIFVLAAMLSPMAFWLHWESMVAAELRPIAENAPVLQLVWIFGGLPLTAFFLILAVAHAAEMDGVARRNPPTVV